MKKKIIIVTIIISLIIFVGYTRYNEIRSIFKSNWGIENMPNSQKSKIIINYVGAGDAQIYEIIQYKQKDINYMINNIDVFEKMTEVKLEEIYHNVLINHFIHHLNEEELKIFNDTFLMEELSAKENYYALLEKQSKSRGYVFDLLVLDTQKNQMHWITCNFG